MLTSFKTGNTTGYEILNYDLEGQNARLRQSIDFEGEFMLADEIVQNNAGNTFCMPYFDSGQFKVHFFNNENPELDSLDCINSFLKIHDHKKFFLVSS